MKNKNIILLAIFITALLYLLFSASALSFWVTHWGKEERVFFSMLIGFLWLTAFFTISLESDNTNKP